MSINPNIDLSKLEAGDELVPKQEIELGYGKNTYPSLDKMLGHLEKQKKKPLKVDLDRISINGECVNDDMEDYLAKEAISSGNLKEASKSPLAFYVDYMGQIEERKLKNKKYLELGSHIHTAILEPELFEKVVIKPKCNLVTNRGLRESIRFYNDLSKFKTDLSNLGEYGQAELRELNVKLMSDCTHLVVSEEDKLIIDAIKVNYFSYGRGIIPKIMKGAISEVSMYSKDPIHGLDVKIRPDAINFAENIGVNAIISVKTTSKEDIRSFIGQSASLLYEVSEGFYQNVASHVTGRRFNATIMIMLQTVPPFQPVVFWWSPDSIEVGKYKANHSLSIIAECFENGVFPGLDSRAPQGNNGIYELELPSYSFLEETPFSIKN